MKWLSVVIFSLICGYAIVRYLISSPLDMSLYGALAIGCFCVALWSLFRMRKTSKRIAAIGLMIIGIISGYLITCTAALKPKEQKNAFYIEPKTARTQGHTAIIYFTHGEPRTYEGSFDAWLEAIDEMDKTGVPFVPKPFRPFFFKKVRDEYFRVGGSFHNTIHGRMMDKLQEVYREKIDKNARFYLSYSDDTPHPDEMAVKAINDGADKVILLNVWLTDSDHSDHGKEIIEALQPEKYGVKMCVTETLWNSERMKRMIVNRANRATGSESKADIGILLVAHGQPAEWDKIFKKQPEQENIFRQETKKLLIAEGYKEQNIELAYMEFKQPAIKEAVKQLLQNDVKKILVSPVNISAESIHSEHEIPSLVAAADVPPDVSTVHLGAWNDDQYVIDALLEKLKACK
jgi:protoheme ferro-lyase